MQAGILARDLKGMMHHMPEPMGDIPPIQEDLLQTHSAMFDSGRVICSKKTPYLSARAGLSQALTVI